MVHPWTTHHNFLPGLKFSTNFSIYDKGYYLNQTIWRTNVKIGKRFTTRVDIPWVYNTKYSPEGYKHSGIGDISFRLLGYRYFRIPEICRYGISRIQPEYCRIAAFRNREEPDYSTDHIQ